MRLTILGSGDAFGSGGRFNTCLHLTTAAGGTLLIDLGASSHHALARSGLDRNAIQAILFTHYHGDHFAGLPFFLLDAQFVTRREAPLIIAGPKGVRERVRTIMEATFPGFFAAQRPFAIEYRDVTPERAAELAGVAIDAVPVIHDDSVGPCQGYRFRADGKTIAFSGDTIFTETLPPLAAGADVFLVECYSSGRKLPNHIDLQTLLVRLPDLKARRILLTHMGPTMLADRSPLPAPLERAEDGMVIEP